MFTNKNSPDPEVDDEPEEEIRPSNLPMQTVRPDVFVPISVDKSAKTRRAVSLTKKLVIVAGLLFSILAWNVWVMQPFFVEGDSMAPTLSTKDTLLVNKFPQTWAGITNSKYIPARFDVVIVKNPAKPEENFVKRVVALPGERVVLKNGVIKVYNERNPKGEDVTLPPCCKDLEETTGTVDTTVREGHIFVVGDNRTIGGSIDSRSSLGQIPSRYIVGRAVTRITPISQFKFL
jgi:signal peptidase I